MSIQTKAEKFFDIYLDWRDLKDLEKRGRRFEMRDSIILGKVAVPAALFYYDALDDVYTAIYLPKRVDLSPPVPGDQRVIAVIFSEQFIAYDLNRPVPENCPSTADGIKLIATGD